MKTFTKVTFSKHNKQILLLFVLFVLFINVLLFIEVYSGVTYYLSDRMIRITSFIMSYCSFVIIGLILFKLQVKLLYRICLYVILVPLAICTGFLSVFAGILTPNSRNAEVVTHTYCRQALDRLYARTNTIPSIDARLKDMTQCKKNFYENKYLLFNIDP